VPATGDHGSSRRARKRRNMGSTCFGTTPVHPDARGNDVVVARLDPRDLGSSRRARERRRAGQPRKGAETTPWRWTTGLPSAVHPRFIPTRAGTTPRRRRLLRLVRRFIPTRAGTTWERSRPSLESAVHPDARGDDELGGGGALHGGSGSSRRARERRPDEDALERGLRFIPTRGNDSRSSRASSPRGNDTPKRIRVIAGDGSSRRAQERRWRRRSPSRLQAVHPDARGKGCAKRRACGPVHPDAR